MARIAGIDLPRDKRVEISLTYIFGIGPTTARNILKRVGIPGEKRVRDLDAVSYTHLTLPTNREV